MLQGRVVSVLFVIAGDLALDMVWRTAGMRNGRGRARIGSSMLLAGCTQP